MNTKEKTNPAAEPKTIVINKWYDIFKHGINRDEWPEIKRYRTRHLFRGLGDSSWELSTDLQRCMKDDEELITKLESLMLRNFGKYAQIEPEIRASKWALMSVARHHVLPTRIMDWTNSILVALHFVTAKEKYFDKDGVVWSVNYEAVYNMLKNDYKLNKKILPRLAKVFTIEELTQLAPSLEALDKLGGKRGAKNRKDFMLFFEPPCIDARFANQYAVFSVMSSATLKPEEWLKAHPELYTKYIIPAKIKSDIRDALDQANITERVLFPGLDGLSKWLRRHYGPPTRKTFP